MSAHVLAPETLATPRRTTRRSPFFAVMAGLTLFIVLAGFAPTLYLRPLFDPEPIPGYLYVHGIVLTTWFVWFFMQTLLVQAGRTALHRRLGVAGAVLAMLIPVAGLMATMNGPGRIVASGIDMNADASVLVGVGVSGVSVRQFAATVVFSNLASAVSFAVLAWTGILLRRRVAIHRRLMLLATLTIIGPALARLSRLPMFGGEQGPFVLVVNLTLVAMLIVHDLVTTRRVHPATVLGIALYLALLSGSLALSGTSFALGLVRWLE